MIAAVAGGDQGPLRGDGPGSKGLLDGIFRDGFESGDATAWSRTVTAPPETTPPQVTILEPAAGATLDALVVDVTGTLSDQSPIASVTVNGEAAAFGATGFSATATLAAGANTLEVVAADVLGNVGTASVSVTTAPESTPPSIAIVDPVPGVFLASARPVVEVLLSDGESGIYLPGLTFAADGTEVPASCAATAGGALCSLSSALPEGPVTLVATARDRALNTATASVDFTVDTVGVQVAVTSPADGLVTAAGSVAVTGTAGPGIVGVTVGNVAATLAGGGFSATVSLREGMNVLVAHAVKDNGNSGSASIEVTRDTTAPIVRIQTPRDGLVAVDDRIAVTGLVNDTVSGGALPRVFVNGAEALVSNGTFLLLDLELVPGPNPIEVVAADSVGNEDRDAVTVRLQRAAGAKLRIASGNGQFGMVNEAVSDPLVVAVTDSLGNPVAGRVVTFEVTRNSGVLRASGGGPATRRLQAVTGGAGRAAALLTLGDTVGEGNNRVRVTGVGVAGEVEFCASGLAAFPDKILAVEGGHQRGRAGAPLPRPLEALVVDRDGNPIAGLEVTFEVLEGGGTLDAASTRVVPTGIDGVARAVLTLGPQPGIANNVVRASFEDLAGLSATFTSSGLAAGAPASTELAGVLLDSAQEPIPGATVTIEGTPLETVTDGEGRFLLSGVPVGDLILHVDPTTGSRPEEFPPLSFETVTVAGQRNTLGRPILLPVLDMGSARVVGGPDDVTLTMDGVEGLTLTVFADSATFPDGSPTGVLSLSQVHLDKVPMTPPNGSTFMPPAWTIQPAGVVFDPPARVTLPNDGLPPGRVIDIFQFDHELDRFINVGKGTVSDDGFLIASDPGFGITRSGWGGGGQPPPPTTDNENDPCQKSADETLERANGLAQSNPNAAPFARIQACIARESCSTAKNGGFRDGEWIETVVPKFVNEFLDQTGEWPAILQSCADPSGTHFIIIPSVAIAEQWCARIMAQHHIENDLLDAMVRSGSELGDPGRACARHDSDWNKVFSIIETCVPEGNLFDPFGFAADEVEDRRDKIRENCRKRTK